MAKINADKRSLIRWKVYIDRSRMYVGYIQFFMIGFVFLKEYKDTSFGQWVFDSMLISLPVLFILFIVLSLVLGRIDTLLGLREEELRNSSSSNPVMREILRDLREIKKELEMLREASSPASSANDTNRLV